MKIQGCNPDSFIIKNPVKVREKAEFGGIMADAVANTAKADDTGALEQAQRLTRCVTVNMSFRAAGGDNTTGYKNLVSDSARLDSDIMRHIEDVCGDDTGKTIDMAALDELLGIYIESAKEV